MKKILFIGLTLFMNSSYACDNLIGVWECTDNDSQEISDLEIKSTPGGLIVGDSEDSFTIFFEQTEQEVIEEILGFELPVNIISKVTCNNENKATFDMSLSYKTKIPFIGSSDNLSKVKVVYEVKDDKMSTNEVTKHFVIEEGKEVKSEDDDVYKSSCVKK